jgi:hypothetical protein
MQNHQLHSLLTVSQFMRLRRWSYGQFLRAKKSGRVFCIVHADVEYVPAFLAERQLLKGGVERVCKLLAVLPAGSMWQFFTAGKASLNGLTPLQCIAEARIKPVMTAARGFLER